MELKASLAKPCTEKERADFIVENNHRLMYEIRETDEVIEAWGYTDSEQEQIDYENKVSEVKGQRRILLEESDLWMLLDRYNSLSAERQTELTTYRQALRDVPEQEGFPYDVVWPTKPIWFNPENVADASTSANED